MIIFTRIQNFTTPPHTTGREETSGNRINFKSSDFSFYILRRKARVARLLKLGSGKLLEAETWRLCEEGESSR